MAEYDWLTLLLPTVISGVIAVIILGMGRLSKTSDSSIMHSVKVENLETRVTEHDKKFAEMSHSFDAVWRKLNDVHSTVNLHEYRLNSLDDKDRVRDRERDRADKSKKAPL